MAGRRVLLIHLAAVCLLPSALCRVAGDISEKELGCGAGQHRFGESCFWVSSSDLYTWGQGEDECTLRGMQLASLSSQEEHDFLWGLSGDTTWIGLNDLAGEGTYEWTDGTALDFVNWGPYEPTGGEAANCVFMYFGNEAKWGDSLCDNQYRIACRGPASAP